MEGADGTSRSRLQGLAPPLVFCLALIIFGSNPPESSTSTPSPVAAPNMGFALSHFISDLGSTVSTTGEAYIS
jgi:hypothetical protein